MILLQRQLRAEKSLKISLLPTKKRLNYMDIVIKNLCLLLVILKYAYRYQKIIPLKLFLPVAAVWQVHSEWKKNTILYRCKLGNWFYFRLFAILPITSLLPLQAQAADIRLKMAPKDMLYILWKFYSMLY